MKRLSEACKITGLSRRALQGYAEKGVLSPSFVARNSYWYYDDEAIKKLFAIKALAAGGYTRERMKEFFQTPDADMMNECDRLIASLEEERRRIDGKIRAIRLFKIENRLSVPALETLSRVEVVDRYRERSFAQSLEDVSRRLSKLYGDVDALNLEAYLVLWYTLAVVGLLKEYDGPERTLASVEEAYHAFVGLMDAMDGGAGDVFNLDDAELRDSFPEFVENLLGDVEVGSSLERVCGEGACKRILQAIEFWGQP